MEAVATRPIRSVTPASADKSVKGSKDVDGVAALQRLDRHVEHAEMVGHEEGVELRRFETLGEALEARES